jgi:hypothetical protein
MNWQLISIALFLLFLLSFTPSGAQTQLDIQGDPTSTDTVAKIRVNYSGLSNVVGLSVHSAPYGDSFGYGIGGDFFGGYRGIVGRSEIGTGVYGYSDSNRGVYGRSMSGYGVLGYSDSGTGVDGYSDSGTGVYGHSDSNHGVSGYSDSDHGLS